MRTESHVPSRHTSPARSYHVSTGAAAREAEGLQANAYSAQEPWRQVADCLPDDLRRLVQ
jgi:hypothetical protein